MITRELTTTEIELFAYLAEICEENYNFSLKETLEKNPFLAEEIIDFKNLMADITFKVVIAAIKRKTEDKPSMSEQDYLEHVDHLYDHLRCWTENENGDEDTVLEQAAHTLCRAMLAFYTYTKHNPT